MGARWRHRRAKRRQRVFCAEGDRVQPDRFRGERVDGDRIEREPSEGGVGIAAGAMVAAAAPQVADGEGMSRGSIAAWIAVGILGVGAMLASRTGRRVMRTGWAGVKAAAKVGVAKAQGEENPVPRVVREAFEDLGPTYIKLGQLVASSHGMFPEAYCQEFRKCLDQVKPFSYEEVHRTIRAELGRDPAEVFAAIDPRPLASASIAQVHAARLRDGQDVVIKVQRPGIGNLVSADLRVLRLLAHAGSHLKHGDLANPVGIVEDFEAHIRAELDFGLEASNMSEFNRIMLTEGQTRVAAPRVVDELTTRRILVMERFYGHRVDDMAKIQSATFDVEERLLLGMRAWFQCLILHGFFHGDVHAGNLMALDDGRIGFLDFGIVGRFAPERRRQVTDYLLAFAVGDFDKLAQTMVAMGSVDPSGVDMGAMSASLREAYEPVLTNEASPAKYADIIPTILRTGVKHGMRLPRDFVLVAKQMLYFDRYAKLLAPDLNVFRDPRIVSGLMQDVMRATQGPPPAASAPQAPSPGDSGSFGLVPPPATVLAAPMALDELR
jgi:predicted unusual protein kinase regulating ubiquinone biosynthesis (AarF/ABC1/UbiB family)